MKLPEISLDMSVCDGSDNEDLEVKQEPMNTDKVKSEEFLPGLESESPHSASQDEHDESGRLCVMDLGM